MTTIFPVVALLGTWMAIMVLDHETTWDGAPPTVTLPLPWVAPKLVPLISINAAGAP